MSSGLDGLSPTPIAIEERVLDDLRSRIRSTLWPDDDDNDDARYGVPRALLHDLAHYPASRSITCHGSRPPAVHGRTAVSRQDGLHAHRA